MYSYLERYDFKFFKKRYTFWQSKMAGISNVKTLMWKTQGFSEVLGNIVYKGASAGELLIDFQRCLLFWRKKLRYYGKWNSI